MEMFKTLTSTLLAGDNTIQFTDANITDTSILDCYFTDSDLIIEESNQTGTTVSITVSNHTEPVGVALFINNCDTFTPYDDTDVQNELLQLDTRVTLLGNSINNKQDKLTAGENITILNNVISASGGGGGIDYSTTETDSNIKWIDGNTVFKKVVDKGTDDTVTYGSWFDTNIDITNIDKIISVRGIGSTGSSYDLNAYHNGNRIMTQTSRNNYDATVRYYILEYTKVV